MLSPVVSWEQSIVEGGEYDQKMSIYYVRDVGASPKTRDY